MIFTEQTIKESHAVLMKLSLATLLAVVTSVQTLSFQAGMENKFQKKVCEMLALLLILYNDDHKIHLINHKQIIIERNILN